MVTCPPSDRHVGKLVRDWDSMEMWNTLSGPREFWEDWFCYEEWTSWYPASIDNELNGWINTPWVWIRIRREHRGQSRTPGYNLVYYSWGTVWRLVSWDSYGTLEEPEHVSKYNYLEHITPVWIDTITKLKPRLSWFYLLFWLLYDFSWTSFLKEVFDKVFQVLRTEVGWGVGRRKGLWPDEPYRELTTHWRRNDRVATRHWPLAQNWSVIGEEYVHEKSSRPSRLT